LSAFYSLTPSVRQELQGQRGLLSPFLFAVYIDGIADKVINTNVSCYISATCCCIVLYADDIVLIAPSVSALQILLNVCEEELLAFDRCMLIKRNQCVFDLVDVYILT